jgi:hypothetical protein
VIALFSILSIHNRSGIDAKIASAVESSTISRGHGHIEKSLFLVKTNSVKSDESLSSFENVLHIRGGQAITKKKVRHFHFDGM